MTENATNSKTETDEQIASNAARQRLLLRRMSICTLLVVALGPLALFGGAFELALIPALLAAAVSAVTAFQLRALRAY
jgi:hypothetical protein